MINSNIDFKNGLQLYIFNASGVIKTITGNYEVVRCVVENKYYTSLLFVLDLDNRIIKTYAEDETGYNKRLPDVSFSTFDQITLNKVYNEAFEKAIRWILK